ncbi:ribonuclease Z [Hymenobacter sp. HMF4947]|uniref:Ribonuclease Z n=1 Tax=Hymenobacter ginkgonis TaxID=2682976 RepID=A0A7K1T927_9BACT|nr:ribonuclease Z [Hymenobacter ginkgonis]MVN74802.1 ribonuclease Z [Hymenobacter ginkgonis]
MTFELQILGSGSATPMVGRHPTAQLLAVEEGRYLIDCGEGTQLRLLEHRRRLSSLRVVFISHLHGDHFFGLFGLLSTMHLQGRQEPLTVVGPPGLDLVLTTQAFHSRMQPGYNITFVPVDTEAHAVVYEDALVRVWSLPMHHRIACAGYLFEEQPRRDKLVKEKLPAGLTPTELAQLAQGQDLPADPATGRPALAHADVSVPAAPPRRYAFCSDTIYTPALAELVQGVDLLYHEATFLHDMRERAAQTYHSTARQAAELAHTADAHRLLIGHFSSRYKQLDAHLQEAREIFPWTELATEGLLVSV